MNIRKKKNNILTDLIFSKFSLVICLVLLITIVFGIAKSTIKSYKVNTEVEDLKSEISRLEGQNQGFDQLIQFLNSDDFVEQEAKLKLGYKKQGEHLVIIPEEKQPVAEQPAELVTNLSNPQKWWIYFFNDFSLLK